MKNKVWAISPFLYIATAMLTAMAGVSWFFTPMWLYLTESGIAVVMIILTVIFTIRFKLHIKAALIGAGNISGNELQNLNDFQVPVMIIGTKEDIIWMNTAFLNEPGFSEYIGMHISTVIGDTSLSRIIESSINVSLGDREFTVFGRYTDSGGILYFIEDTHYKRIARQYAASKPVVVVAAFDNKDEMNRDSNSGEETRILGQVESTLSDWAYSVGGMYKKLSGGTRYLIIMDEKSFEKEKREKFTILEKIHEVKTAQGRSATVSIGVGRGASSYAEAEKWAVRSIDMALGRGGDQVAIKMESDSFEFYGGLSKGNENRDKSRTRVIAGAITDLIRRSDMVFCMGHKFSDLDSVGSSVGMWSVAKLGLGKKAYVVIDKNQSLSKTLIDYIEKNSEEEDHPVFITPAQALEMMTNRTLLIVTDTHSQDYVESPKLLEKAGKTIVIDHHRMVVRHIENTAVFYHETYASSASEMVAEICQFVGNHRLKKYVALALLSGIMLDTKGFVVRCGVRTFEAAAYLRRRGADAVEAKRMFSGSIESYKAKFQIVSNAEVYGSCAIACTSSAGIKDIRIVASQAADELLAIQGVTASFVLFDYGDSISISARSMGDVNVQLIMEELGGGGHLTMAGAQLEGMNLESGKMKLLEALKTTLPKATKFPD